MEDAFLGSETKEPQFQGTDPQVPLTIIGQGVDLIVELESFDNFPSFNAQQISQACADPNIPGEGFVDTAYKIRMLGVEVDGLKDSISQPFQSMTVGADPEVLFFIFIDRLDDMPGEEVIDMNLAGGIFADAVNAIFGSHPDIVVTVFKNTGNGIMG
jgi:hypothetical protein